MDEWMNESLTYKEAGVDVERGEKISERIGKTLRSTWGDNVKEEVAGFKGVLDRGNKWGIGATDGPGTKLLVALMMNNLKTIGQDVVAMTANDILRVGGHPLFFLDYVAHGNMPLEKNLEIVEGIARACKLGGFPFIGGETAEMWDVYGPGELDIAGFMYGEVNKDKLIDGSQVTSGARVIGIESSGLHANGYTLARKVVFDVLGLDTDDYLAELGRTVGQELLEPTLLYNQAVHDVLETFPGQIQGMAHVTGGGLPNKGPNSIPEGLGMIVEEGSWPVHPIFDLIAREGPVDIDEMRKVYNMGIGFTLAVNDSGSVDDIIAQLEEDYDLNAYDIGEVREGRGVEYVGGE